MTDALAQLQRLDQSGHGVDAGETGDISFGSQTPHAEAESLTFSAMGGGVDDQYCLAVFNELLGREAALFLGADGSAG